MLLNCGTGENSRVPWTARRPNQSILKEISPLGNIHRRTDAEAETPILWPLDSKNWLIGKDLDAGKDWRQEEKGMIEDEMVGWHHWLNGPEFEQVPGVGWWTGKPGVLQSMGSKRVGHDWVTELNPPLRTFMLNHVSSILNLTSWIPVQDQLIPIKFHLVSSAYHELVKTFLNFSSAIRHTQYLFQLWVTHQIDMMPSVPSFKTQIKRLK